MDKTRRAFIIYDLIKRNRVTNRQEIKGILREEYDDFTSIRTISRAITHLEQDFNIDIKYDDERYNIEDQSMLNESLVEYFDSLHFRLYTLGFHDDPRFEEYVIYDTRHRENITKVNNVLSSILLAITKRIPIRFNYQRYGESNSFEVTLEPYYLKEYQLNWYVEGINKDKNEKRIYGLDRLTNLHLVNESTFARDDDYPLKNPNLVGIYGRDIHGSKEVQEVKVKLIDRYFSEYIQNNPIHSSQKRLHTDEQGYSTYSYKLIINYEFVGELMRLDKNCKVLAPDTLITHMKSLLTEMLEHYKD